MGVADRGFRLFLGCLDRRRLCRARRRLHILAFAGQHGDDRIDRDVLCPLRHHDLGERALVDRLVFHRGLVGLDLGDHIAGLDLVALLLQPARKIALLHRRRQCRHEDVGGHLSSAGLADPRLRSLDDPARGPTCEPARPPTLDGFAIVIDRFRMPVRKLGDCGRGHIQRCPLLAIS